MLHHEPQTHDAKQKPDIRGSMLYDSICMKYPE